VFDALSPDHDDVHAMRVTHWTFIAVASVFLVLGAVAIGSRFGAPSPEDSVAYGSAKAPEHTIAVFGD
jgi:hypothetical protein